MSSQLSVILLSVWTYSFGSSFSQATFISLGLISCLIWNSQVTDRGSCWLYKGQNTRSSQLATVYSFSVMVWHFVELYPAHCHRAFASKLEGSASNPAWSSVGILIPSWYCQLPVTTPKMLLLLVSGLQPPVKWPGLHPGHPSVDWCHWSLDLFWRFTPSVSKTVYIHP